MDYLRSIFTTPIGQTVNVDQERYLLRKQRPSVAVALDALSNQDAWVKEAIRTDDGEALTADRRAIQKSALSIVFRFEAEKSWLVKRNLLVPARFIFGRAIKGLPAYLDSIPKWMSWTFKSYLALTPAGDKINPLRVVPAERAREAIAQNPERFNKIAMPETFLWDPPEVDRTAPIEKRLIPVEEMMEVMNQEESLQALVRMEPTQAEELLRQLFRLNGEAMLLTDLHPGNALLSKDGTKMVPIDFEPIGGMKDASQEWDTPRFWDPRLFGLLGIERYVDRVYENKGVPQGFKKLVKRVAGEECSRLIWKYRLEYGIRYSVRALLAIALFSQLRRLPSLWKPMGNELLA